MLEHDEHVVNFVDDYLHEVLSSQDAKYVEQHCEECPICRVALEEAEKRLSAMQAVPLTESSEELIQETLAKIDDDISSRHRLRRITFRSATFVAAASVAIIGCLHLYYLNLSPSPYDLRVYGQNELLANTTGALRVRFLNHNTKETLKDVPIDIELHDRREGKVVRLASFRTDDLGTGQPQFQLPDWADGDYELRVVARTAGKNEIVTKTVKLKRSWKLMLSTDKPVYQPGQTIRIRSLAMRRPDLKPVAGNDIVFSITDPKSNVIFKQRDVTSRFGIASADCPLATEIIEGPYTIQCLVGDTESSATVEVRKYVLPKFKIDLGVEESYYSPGDWVRGSVEANYFFGKPVAGAQVGIEVLTTEIGPTILDRISSETDSEGTTQFEYKLPDSLVGREQQSGDAQVTMRVTVIDTVGQKQSASISRVVTSHPLRVEVIPESGTLVKGIPNTIYFFTTYADGRPASSRLAVSGITEEIRTNDLGVTSAEVVPQTEEITLTVRATDEQGLIARRSVKLKCGAFSQDFIIRTDRAVYNGGDTIHLVAVGGGAEPVFVDFIKDGQTILTESIDLSEGRGEYEFDLPPELFGTIQLCAYRFGSAGLPIRKTRLLYVSQAGQLKIDAQLDRQEYRPGHQAKLRLTLTDETGQPAPGAISLAAVDEAVFSVLSQVPGMERTFFNLEQDMLQPIYAIYPWSPNLTTSLPTNDRVILEKALFSLASKTRISRDEVLQALVDEGIIVPRYLEVLNSPYLELALDNLGISGNLRNLVEAGGPHTLSIASYGPKVQKINRARSSGLSSVRVAWKSFAVVFVVVVVLLGAYRLGRSVLAALLILAVLALIVAIMLPSLSRARELSRGAVEFALLGRVEMDLDEFQSKGIVPREEADRKGQSSVRVREWFPETLLWRSELITDDSGQVSLDIALADSITTWRLSASAVSAEGRLGGMQSAIRVFQPFFVDLNLPVSLTRGDEVSMPVVVYNYLDHPQTVELSIEDAEWFELLEDPSKFVELGAGEVASTSYRIRVKKVGSHELQVTARGEGVADAIKRQVEVVPDGQRVEQVFNGVLREDAQIDISIPEDAIEGSAKTIVKIYPSSFSQLVESLDSIFQRPYGCFEQTSSTTYPNVLALEYLRSTKQSVPEVEAMARQYIHLGYQRLLSFEVDGGGFDWFGRPPANRTLTAYGLMEFEDMAKVHDVDPRLIERTRQWLLNQRNADGSWSPEGHKMHIDPTRGSNNADLSRLSTTAYIGWAVFGGQAAQELSRSTRAYLLAISPQSIDDPYVLALVCNALIATEADDGDLRRYLNRLHGLRKRADESKLAWWDQSPSHRTTFYGAGRSGSIETTALAALAMLKSGYEPNTVRGVLSWLVEQKDSLGTWHSTQATVLALKAMLAGTGTPLGGEREYIIQVAVEKTQPHEDVHDRKIVLPADQSDVMKQLDLSGVMGVGEYRLTLTDQSDSGATYQVSAWYHVRETAKPVEIQSLTIELVYDRSELRVGDVVSATATIINNMATAAPMVILDLPVPAGFTLDPDDWESLVADGSIAKYQITARSAVVYLRRLQPDQALSIRYDLRATMPVKIKTQPATAYEYYDPDKQASSRATRLTVLGRT